MTKEQEQALDNEFKQATKEINDEMAEFMRKYREHQKQNEENQNKSK